MTLNCAHGPLSGFRQARLFLAAFALILATVVPSVAGASGPEDVWEVVGVTIHDLAPGKEPTYVITAQARQGMTLPFQAAMSLPKGSKIIWAGELLGGDPSQDPMVQLDMEEGEEYDKATFTMNRSNIVQFELVAPEGMIVPQQTFIRLDLHWPAVGAIDRARIAVIVPTDLHLENTEPALDVDVRSGSGVLYSVETSPVAAGQSLSLRADMVGGPAPELVEQQGGAVTTQTPPATVTPSATPPGPVDDSSLDLGSREIILAVMGFLLLTAVAALLWRLRKDRTASAG